MRDAKGAENAQDLQETSRTICGKLPYWGLTTWNPGSHHVDRILIVVILRFSDGKTIHVLE